MNCCNLQKQLESRHQNVYLQLTFRGNYIEFLMKERGEKKGPYWEKLNCHAKQRNLNKHAKHDKLTYLEIVNSLDFDLGAYTVFKIYKPPET